MNDTATVKLPDAFGFLFDPPLGSIRYRVAYGGRGSAKSWSFARALLLHGVSRPLRILCAREYQSSIRDSVHRLLKDQIQAMGLGGFYAVERSRIYAANSTEFFFLGIKRDPHSIKSLEGVDLCWVEEGEAISRESLDILVPTIRKPGSEIWVSFNPKQPEDPAYHDFVTEPRDRAIVRRVSWLDNPWLGDVLRHEQEELLRRDPEAHAHVWGGEPWKRSKDQVFFGKWRVAEFEPEEHWDDPLYGADWGFAHDPTVLERCWIADSRLWIDYDERGIGWSAAEIDRRFRRVPGADDHTIRGDAARPETINELCQRGLDVVAAPKWSGSVEDGVEHLRGYDQIVIHPRCKGLIEEARLYRYKTDPRTGDVLPKILDAHNHGWDAVRYALAPIIQKRDTAWREEWLKSWHG